MKYNHTIIATCIVAAFASSPAFAKDSRHFHEDDWGKTRSYAAVMISQDSVDNWGAWGDFVEPAAGAPSLATMPGMGGGNSYRNNPITVLSPDQGCAAGTWCGYAIYKIGKHSPYQAGLFDLNLATSTPNPESETQTFRIIEGSSSTTYPGSTSWRLSQSNGTEVAASNDIYANFGGGTFSPEVGYWKDIYEKQHVKNQWGKWAWKDVKVGEQWITLKPEGYYFDNRDDELHHFTADGTPPSVTGFSHNSNANEATNEIPGTWMLVEVTKRKFFGFTFYDEKWEKVSPFTDAIANADVDVAIGKLYGYTTGNSETDGFSSKVSGYYVAGIPTAAGTIADLRANGITATYKGGSYDGSRQGYVTLNVDFGTSKWNGTWFGGLDQQAMNFTADGKITGANIASTSVSASGNNAANVSYAGSVSGTFYGTTASSVGGVSSIQKSVNDSVVQTQNAVFLANKVLAK